MHWEYTEDVSPCASRSSPFHSGSFWIPGDAENSAASSPPAPDALTGLGSGRDVGMAESKSLEEDAVPIAAETGTHYQTQTPKQREKSEKQV